VANSTDLIATVAVKINAKTNKVWEALTTPSIIKQYLFGTDTISDWKEGSRITFKGAWDGKEYIDGGTILKIEPEKVLQYTYWSSMSGTEDLPENYATITFEILKEGNTTLLTLTNDNCKTEKLKDHLAENWKAVLNSLKEIVEK
jgi:uncharacterized protein YndB with AHSA1/START domain